MKLSRKEKIVWACVITAWASANLIYYFMYMREAVPVLAPDVSQQNAREVLHQTLEIAYNGHKNILVHVSGPGWSWCRKFGEFLDKHHHIFGKYYVVINLDTRMKGLNDIITALRPYTTSIPGTVILNDTGQILASGNRQEGNIGYPAEPKSAKHFAHILQSTSTITADELETIQQALVTPRH